jgi:hypothetical protein
MNSRVVIVETIKQYITEDKSSKNRSRARKYLRNKGYDNNKIIEVENALINKLSPYIRDNDFKFMLGVARYYVSGNMNTNDNINKLKQTIKLINTSHLDEYDNNLNNLSFTELINRFSGAVKQSLVTDKESLSQKEFDGRGDYDIIRIDDYKQAKSYSKYTMWCVARNESAFNSYSNNGAGVFYFLLRKGFEKVKPVVGENAPKDDYGMSMIAVSVDERGVLNTSTTRWNHSNGGNDNMFTTNELSELVGGNFYSIFKPRFSEDELIDEIMLVGRTGSVGTLTFKIYNKKSYLIKNGKVSLDYAFDNVGDFNDGVVKVKVIGNGYNFLDGDGELLSDVWFDHVNGFINGHCVVSIDNKGYNVINTKGDMLSTEWFDYAYNNKVRINSKGWNIFNDKMRFLSEVWFDHINECNNNMTIVKINNKGYNIITNDGDYVFNNWFDELSCFYGDYAIVRVYNKGYNLINKESKLLFDVWFDRIAFDIDDYYKAIKRDVVYYINGDGEVFDDNKKMKIDTTTIKERRIITYNIIRDEISLFKC